LPNPQAIAVQASKCRFVGRCRPQARTLHLKTGGFTACPGFKVSIELAPANEVKDVAKEAKKPKVARDIAAFQKSVANAKDIQTALKNPNVMKVLLTANNLSKYI
jgi:hypothetical protein